MADPVDDPLQETGQAIGGTLRTAAAGAGEILRMKLTRQAYEDRESAVAAQLEAQNLTQRLQAEQATARLLYRLPADPAWWRRVSAEDVVGVWNAATAFRDTDPAARTALDRLGEGLRDHPQLRDDVLRDYPGSLVAQAVATGPPAAEAGGLALAAAADLEVELVDDALDQRAVTAAADNPWHEDIHAAADGEWPNEADPATVAALVGEDFPSGQSRNLAAVIPPVADTAGITPGISLDMDPETWAAADLGRLLEDDFPARAAASAGHLDPAGEPATPPQALPLPPALSLPGAGVER